MLHPRNTCRKKRFELFYPPPSKPSFGRPLSPGVVQAGPGFGFYFRRFSINVFKVVVHKVFEKCQIFKHHFTLHVRRTRLAGSIRDFPNTRTTLARRPYCGRKIEQSFGPYETHSMPTTACVERPRKRRRDDTERIFRDEYN